MSVSEGDQAWDSGEMMPPGLGDEDFPGFPADACPAELPDMSRHHSTLADILKKDPSLYSRLRERRTQLDVGLARCVKVGMDCRGHPMVKTIGMVAGDEESYETFRELFDPVIRCRLDDGTFVILNHHPTDLGRHGRGLTTVRADSTGRYVLSSQVRASRSLRGFRFPPAMSREERWEVERLVALAALELQAPMKGQYWPLQGSKSYPPRQGGMGLKEEATLQAAGILFDAPDATLKLCTGAGRHWPEGRGVFASVENNFAVWVNQEEHIRVIGLRQGDAIQLAFREVVRALDSIAGAVRRTSGGDFGQQVYAHSERLGFLTSNPANLGTAMGVSVMVRLPRLSTYKVDAWKAWCMAQRIQVKAAANDEGALLPGVYELSNSDRLGTSEVGTVNLVVEVVSRLVQMEQLLEAGKPIDELLNTDVECPGTLSPRAARAAAVARAEVSQKACGALLLGIASGRLFNAMGALAAQHGGAQYGSMGLPGDDGSGDHAVAGLVLDGILQSVMQDTNGPLKASRQKLLDDAEEVSSAVSLVEDLRTASRASRPISRASVFTVQASSEVSEAAARDIVVSLVDGEVEAFFSATPELKVEHNAATEAVGNAVRISSPNDKTLDGTRSQVACLSGDLENVLGSVFSDRKADASVGIGKEAKEATESGILMKVLSEAKTAPVPPPVAEQLPVAEAQTEAQAKKAGALLMFKVISEKDRRLGELTAMMGITEQLIVDRIESCKQIEEMISSAKLDISHLELDTEWHRRALEGAEERGLELQSRQRQLLREVGYTKNGGQPAIDEKDPLDGGPSVMSARSELSTATGGTMLSTSMSINLAGSWYTPRGVQGQGRLLEPLPPRG